MHAAYFSGYLVSPLLLGRWVLKRWGYKPTFITGLCVYACGTLIFWPSAVLTSYPTFIVVNVIIGAGLGVLEAAADSFIALCGPQQNAEIRLNVAQGIQGIATVVSALLAQKVLYKGVHTTSSLVNAQWTYLSIFFFDVLLAAALYYSPIPEASDEDLQELADSRRDDYARRVLGLPVMWFTFSLGASSLYLYTAGQEVLTTSFENLVATTTPE
jgi:fucose permease